MLETIHKQLKLKKVLAKEPYYQNPPKHLSDFYSDLYPAAMPYYHELNPAFLIQLNEFNLLNNYSTITVRDGLAGFGSYVLKNFQSFPKMKCQHIVHPVLVPLIPPNLEKSFFAYQIYQHNSYEITQARRILISGMISQDTMEGKEKLFRRLEILKKVPLSTPVDICFPQKRNPLGTPWRESYLHYEMFLRIKELLPNHEINFITTSSVLEKNNFAGVFCVDLFNNPLTISDNYLNHFIVSRGGVVNTFASKSHPECLFEIDLSFNHRLQVIPLPKVESIFVDLVFYRKQSPWRDPFQDPHFHQLILRE
jgi:hypothetical protein